MCLPVKPFRIEKEWEHCGLKCAVVMNREQGNRCGYVRVPPGHPEYCSNYNDVNVNVHGGLTFGGIEDCVEEDGRGYWFGFDCAHFGDSWINPNVPSDYQWTSEESEEHHYYIYKTRNLAPIRERDFEHYWTHDEVVAETEQLAQQLSKRE